MKLQYDINSQDVIDALMQLPLIMREEALRKGLSVAGHELASYIKKRHLRGGTTKDRLAVRTGQLMRTTRGMKVTISGDNVGGGVSFGAEYAGVHIGEAGQVTRINIPTYIKHTKAGVPIVSKGIKKRMIEIKTRVHPERILKIKSPLITRAIEHGINKIRAVA